MTPVLVSSDVFTPPDDGKSSSYITTFCTSPVSLILKSIDCAILYPSGAIVSDNVYVLPTVKFFII